MAMMKSTRTSSAIAPCVHVSEMTLNGPEGVSGTGILTGARWGRGAGADWT